MSRLSLRSCVNEALFCDFYRINDSTDLLLGNKFIQIVLPNVNEFELHIYMLGRTH